MNLNWTLLSSLMFSLVAWAWIIWLMLKLFNYLTA